MAKKGIPLLTTEKSYQALQSLTFFIRTHNVDTLQPPPITRPHVTGHLYAVCERDSQGKSILSRKDFKTPIHISKPYWDGNSLLLNLMCPTAGMLAGDSVELKVETKQNASLTLSNPSSLRIHKMDSGSDATWSQHFTVGPNAFLESNPEWLILQGDSSFTQHTSIEIENRGELFFIESIAPGRIAHQEAFQFRRFRNRLSLRYAGKLSLLEKYSIETSQNTADPWQNRLGDARPFYVSLILVSEKMETQPDLWKSIYQLQTPLLKIGASKLAHGPCWSVKLLASEPIAARKTIQAIRTLFFDSIGRTPAQLRRQ